MSKINKILLGVLAIAAVAAVFYIYNSTKSKLALSVAAPNEALVGAPIDFRVEFSNKSGGVLNSAVISVSLPEGAVFLGSGEEKVVSSKNLGNVGADSLIAENFKIIFLRGVGSSKKIKATVSYSQNSMGAKFESSKEAEILIIGRGISFEFTGPEKVFNGEDFDFGISYKNVSPDDFSELQLKADYPPNFSFLSSTLKPDIGKNIWNLGDLRKGSEGKFLIKGNLIGPDNSAVNFSVGVKARIGGVEYNLEPQVFSLSIAPSPLILSVRANNAQDYIAKPGDELEYAVSYVNSTDVALREVEVRAQLSGDMFDFNSLDTNGAYQFSNNTIIWNSRNVSDLGFVSPNTAGTVRFKIKTKQDYPIRRFGDKDFILKVSAEIESPTVPSSITASRTFSVAKLETKVAGKITVDTKGYFRDADSGILNNGTMPPRVGKPTNFTIHWLLSNFASDASNIEVRTSLRDGVKFTGTSKSNFGSAPEYDSASNQVVWKIDSLVANKGVVDQPLEAIFQIEATPRAGQAGSYIPLISETTVKATDNFTGVEFSASENALTTALPDDSSVGAQGGVVQP